jgi:hypothetical protein
MHCKKGLRFYVTNQILPVQEKLNYSRQGRVWNARNSIWVPATTNMLATAGTTSYNKTPAATKMPAETVKVSIISDMVLLHMK